MNPTPDHVKHYHSAQGRFLKPVIMDFFARECPRFFGPLMREKIADELLALFEASAPAQSRVQPGQLVWNALDRHTRATSPHRRCVPVILTLISEDDIEQLVRGVPMRTIGEQSIARMMREAYAQGGLLSSRDVGLLTLRHGSTVSAMRLRYERTHQCTLPHTGSIHDMGSCVSHKRQIITKTVIERKDPAQVARETNHSQAAVDRYLKDYHRVKTLYHMNHDVDFINRVTQIARHVIHDYITLIQQEQTSC
jgi:hypothetical protein